MKPFKSLFLKTYGKERRKLSAWISPENRKLAFDSSRSTDGDSSVFEPVKPARMRERRSVASRRPGRPAKKKAMLCLAEKSCDEENTLSASCLEPAQLSKTARAKKTRVATDEAVYPAKRKAMPCLTDTSSDEENISRPSPLRPQAAQQCKTTRSVASRRPGRPAKKKAMLCLAEKSCDEENTPSASCLQPAQLSKTASGHLPSAGRFVTRRRRAAVTKPKLPKATFSMLNSSDDFTSGALASTRILRPSRRRVPPVFVVSSAENSMNAAGGASFATIPFREISLNESADHSLGLCPRKPIFCSTPSAGSFRKQPLLKPLSTDHQSSSPPSMSLSCIGVLTTFQEEQTASPPHCAPPVRIHSEEKLQSNLGEEEPHLHHYEESSADLFVEPKSTNKMSSCSDDTKDVRKLPQLNLLSTDDSESSSRFVSAAGGLEWLVEALKEKCLTERCTVQLERLDNLTASQLCSQTPYSSCSGRSTSTHSQTNGHSLTVDLSQSSEPAFNIHLSVTDIKSSDYSHSVNSLESSEHPMTVSQSTDHSPSAEHASAQKSMEQSASELYVESSHRSDSSVEFIMGTQLPANKYVHTLFAVAVEGKALTKKCTVQLKRMTLPQQKSEANKCENGHAHSNEDPEVLSSGEITERMMACIINSSSPVARTQSGEPEMEEKAAALATRLKKKCLTDKVVVEIKRVTLSQLKEILQLRGTKRKSPPDVSDSASDGQTKSDTTHCDEDTSAMKVGLKKRGSTSSQDKTASDKEVKNSRNIPRKAKRTSLAPKEKKRRSTSTDRPGTSRKACVSGMSVSRWTNRGSASTHTFRSGTAQTGANKAVDCSINELISTQHKQPKEWLGAAMNFSTPVRASRLNLSSLLADFTPNTHTWSRLKAALSVHRKSRVTPGRAALADISQDLFATPFRTPLSKHFRSQLLSRDSPLVCEGADLSDEEKVCAECGQPRPLPWEECILPQRMKQCVKIGEGTFGEVFTTTNASGETVALKIIPVEGSEKVNGEDQKTFGEILHEIIISKELSSLKEKQQNKTHGFIGLNDLHCVQGCYPPDFLNAWDAFDERKGSENDRPDFFEKDQLFIILEFEFGGIDLENSSGTLASLVVAKSILHQVTAALAVAEQELHFEHRDLHWGNVLVKTTKQKTGSFLLNGAAHSLETKGVLVRIIDYSLSRLEIDDLTVSCDISSDEELFMGQGDYQFDIYRLMRQENGNNWSNYHPHTNVLWLHYLCSKLLSMKYRSSGGRGAKGMREELTRFYDNVLQYSSATEALQKCPMFQ